MPLSETVEAITPAYAPPEVFAKQPLTEYADVYSLAATLYAILSGHPPRWSETMEMLSLPEMIKRQKVPIKRIPGVDKAFMDALLSAMAEQPESRPTAAQFRDQLAALSLSTQLAPAPQSLPEPAQPEQESGTSDTSEAPPRIERPSAAARAAPDRERSGWFAHRRLLTVAIAAVIIAGISGIVLWNIFSPETPAAVPSPSLTSNAASPTSTPLQVPAGFIDCSEQLGRDIYCATRPECWTGVNGFGDVPQVGVPQDCDKTHVYQTFIAGRMTYELRRQSQLESDAQIRRICTNEVANSMLRSGQRRSDWEIQYLGPQQADEYFFRCIIGRGDRNDPLNFHAP